MRRLAAGLGLAAVLFHVGILSLHVVAMAGAVMAGPEGVSRSGLALMLCGPSRTASPTVLAGQDDSGKTGGQHYVGPQCPFCTGAAAVALLPASLPDLPAYVWLQGPQSPPLVLGHQPHRFEAVRQRGRAPPALA